MEFQSRVSLEEQLKKAILATGKSITAVARASGVTQPALCRFMNGLRGIKLDTAELLCAYLGLTLVPLETQSGEAQPTGERRAA